MATTPQPKAAAGSFSLTGAPAAETPRAKVRVGYSPTLADHVIYADGVQGASMRLG